MTTTASPVTIVPNLVIDTVGPRVTFAAFDRLTGTLTFTFQDFQQDGVTPGGSGLLVQSLSDSANYSLNRVHAPRVLGQVHRHQISAWCPERIRRPTTSPWCSTMVPTTRGDTSGSSPGPQVCCSPLASRTLRVTLLDGEFYGQQAASGNGVPGGDFVANIKAFHQGTPGFGYSGPLTIIGHPHPNDPPAKFPGRTTPPKTKVVSSHPAKALPVNSSCSRKLRP